jgi:FKBP-type peptidyl-prolyl cis-trans isomerase FkpA
MRRPHSIFVFTISALALMSVVASPSLAQEAAEEVPTDKLFYIAGAALSENVKMLNPSDAEMAKAIEGFMDGLKGKASEDPMKYRDQLTKLQQDRMQQAAAVESVEANAFLAKMEKEPGATKVESGLIYTTIKEGSGDSPKPTDQVKVHYHGTLRDGTVFDSSVDRGEPLTFPLNRVIPCWTEGVAMMKPGGKAKLVCPPKIAYGDRPAGKIPPGSALVFEVELIEVTAQ